VRSVSGERWIDGVLHYGEIVRRFLAGALAMFIKIFHDSRAFLSSNSNGVYAAPVVAGVSVVYDVIFGIFKEAGFVRLPVCCE